MKRGTLKRIALLAGGLGTTAALVSAASFALFTSTANAQTDTFQAGTVILSSLSGNNACGPSGVVLNNLEPGDQGTCTYQLTYTGSLNAWVSLNVGAQTYWMPQYTPSGSQTPIGGEALLSDSGGDSAGGALQVSLSDSLGALPAQTPLPLTCPEDDQDGNASASTNGWFSCTNANGSGNVGSYLLPTSFFCPASDSAAQCNNTPTGSWAYNQTDTVTLNWSLPLSAGNAYQNSQAVITLQGNAVQASNNPVPTDMTCVETSTPVIQSVSFSNVGSGMAIDVKGCGFGNAPSGVPGLVDLTNAFSFSDQTQTNGGRSPNGWAAGCTSMPSGVDVYCTPSGGANDVTLNYTSWTNNEIQIQGFGSSYDSSGEDWVVASGDNVTIIVMNPVSQAYSIVHTTLPNA